MEIRYSYHVLVSWLSKALCCQNVGKPPRTNRSFCEYAQSAMDTHEHYDSAENVPTSLWQ